jgi:hypothetical protein
MGAESIQVGDHEFQISLTPTPGGVWTMNVLHIDRSRPTATESRSRIDIEFESEAEALRYANVVRSPDDSHTQSFRRRLRASRLTWKGGLLTGSNAGLFASETVLRDAMEDRCPGRTADPALFDTQSQIREALAAGSAFRAQWLSWLRAQPLHERLLCGSGTRHHPQPSAPGLRRENRKAIGLP